MARVPNKDGQGIIANGAYGVVDPSYDSPTVYGSGVPTTVGFSGEMRVDTATGSIYRFLGPGATNWAETNIR